MHLDTFVSTWNNISLTSSGDYSGDYFDVDLSTDVTDWDFSFPYTMYITNFHQLISAAVVIECPSY